MPAALVVTAEEKNALRVCGLNEAAERAGLRLAMPLADARAILPTLISRIADPERDGLLLKALHRWAGRYSPFISIDGGDALAFDITGCAHLFGGEATMAGELADALEDRGFSSQIGIADTKGAAWALARQERAIAIAAPGATRDALATLPLAALRIERDIVAGLTRLGLSRIGDLYSMGRGPLARRFGLSLASRLDQALGFQYEPIAPSAPVEQFSARMSFPDPIGLQDDVREAMRRLLSQLCKRLERAGAGARCFELTTKRCDHTQEKTAIALARPCRDTALVLRLFEPKLEKLDAGPGIDCLRLCAVEQEPLSERQLTGNPSEQGEDKRDELIARLGNRIGFDRVRTFSPAQSHVPEREFVMAAAIGCSRESRNWPRTGKKRPITLFPPEPVCAVLPGRPPKAISWRGRKIDLIPLSGPERIAPEWWRENSGWSHRPRDYWRVSSMEGERLWIMRDYGVSRDDHEKAWHVCGVFA